MSTFTSHVLYNASAAETGSWYKLNRHCSADRAIGITLANTADTITIEVTAAEVKGQADPETTIVAADVVSAGDFTGESSFAKVLEGNWTYIRAKKTGTGGIAKVTING